MPSSSHIETTELLIKGLIQGVGFRPFIFRHANKFQLKGMVYNQNNGVVVHLQGESENIKTFIDSLRLMAPIAASIESIERKKTIVASYSDFSIQKSEIIDQTITQVSPDIATCPECLIDIKKQERRINYAFTNCTNCGPRFSITENIPYDRRHTSMKKFSLCPDCLVEYENILDRRFHAQPVACNKCGPTYTLKTQKNSLTEINSILSYLSTTIEKGGILAIKGLGGFHLVCDAFNVSAIQKIREIKKRDDKPFALMCSSIETAKTHCFLTALEEEALCSWQRPIVLVKAKTQFPIEIAGNLTNIGVFLPYLPIHYQMFEILKTNTLIMTSGNISDCPIIINNTIALKEFLPITDGILTHNRDIVNRLDDPVMQEVGNNMQMVRRSRGYAPGTISLNFNAEGIFASGAELSNTFCIGKGKQAILSQHIGDLKNLETMEFFEYSFKAYQRLFEFAPKQVVCDLHPDYLSSAFAEKLKLPILKVQHHHAHIASCMAEYGLDESVIGIAYDGTGYGTDGKIWGSEIMIANLSDFERKYHFEYIPIPGGDKVVKEPWRSAISYLYNAFQGEIPQELDFIKSLNTNQLQLTCTAIEKEINSPESCSAGRLFDAVSALLNICVHAGYHSEAPIQLENVIQDKIKAYYPIVLDSEISWKQALKEIVKDLNNKVSVSIISAKFHNSVIHVTYEAIKKINAETGINKVVLSGGSFQNRYMSENLLDLLLETGFKVYMSNKIPVNDGGIALGQLAIAAKTLALCV